MLAFGTSNLNSRPLQAVACKRQPTAEIRSGFIEPLLIAKLLVATIDLIWATDGLGEGGAIELVAHQLRAVRSDYENLAAS